MEIRRGCTYAWTNLDGVHDPTCVSSRPFRRMTTAHEAISQPTTPRGKRLTSSSSSMTSYRSYVSRRLYRRLGVTVFERRHITLYPAYAVGEDRADRGRIGPKSVNVVEEAEWRLSRTARQILVQSEPHMPAPAWPPRHFSCAPARGRQQL